MPRNRTPDRVQEIVVLVKEAHLAGLETGDVDEVVERRAQAPDAVIHRAKGLALGLADPRPGPGVEAVRVENRERGNDNQPVGDFTDTDLGCSP